ncbi:MAG: hypothetical protein WDA03_06580 [Trueperaceae bacterium]
MFDYRFTRNATEYTARLRQEAHNARLAREHTSRLARIAARTFRAWANRLDGDSSKRAEALGAQWAFEAPRTEAPAAS